MLAISYLTGKQTKPGGHEMIIRNPETLLNDSYYMITCSLETAAASWWILLLPSPLRQPVRHWLYFTKEAYDKTNKDLVTRGVRGRSMCLQVHLLTASKCEIKTAINLSGSSSLWERPDSPGLSDTWTLSRLLMEG